MGLSITFQSINHSLMGNSQLEYHNTRTKCILFPLNLLFLKLSCIVEVNTYMSRKLLKNITWPSSRLNIRNHRHDFVSTSLMPRTIPFLVAWASTKKGNIIFPRKALKNTMLYLVRTSLWWGRMWNTQLFPVISNMTSP